MNSNRKLTKLEMPSITHVGDYFLEHNQCLTELEMPNITHVGCNFLVYNKFVGALSKSNTIFETINRNRKKDINLEKTTCTEKKLSNEGKNTEEILQVNETKFEQIYDKAKGKIKEVFLKIKSFLNIKSNSRNDKTNDETIK